nr:hypothetical protein GCM10025699_32940 [Microbacterium flavescens]
MLHPGVRLTIDGGGVVAAPTSALDGASEVAGYLAGVLSASAARLRVASVNGAPGVVVCVQGRATGVLALRTRGRLILEAWLVVNPDKLTTWTC